MVAIQQSYTIKSTEGRTQGSPLVVQGGFRMRLLRFCLSCLLLIGLGPISETRAPETSPPYQGISGSGNNFLEICKHVDEESDAKYTLNNGLCLGWVQGYIEGLTISDEFHQTPADKKMTCPPTGVTVIQFFRIIRKHIDEQPERAHMETRYLASEALIRAFPCVK